jgi:hypothetical protein
MVLELIAIGCGIYFLAKHKKAKRERAAAFAAGQPIHNADGSITYPPNYSGCPTHGNGNVGMRQGSAVQQSYDQKNQSGGLPDYGYAPQQQRGPEGEVPRYTDYPEQQVERRDTKTAVKEPEVREVQVNEKEEYVHV